SITIDHFCAGVVSWDMFGELHAEVLGKRAQWEDENSDLNDAPVPDQFRSAQEYAQVWVPLLVREVRAQTLSGICGEDQSCCSTLRVQVKESVAGTGRRDLGLVDVHPHYEEPGLREGWGRGKWGGGNSDGGGDLTEHDLVLFMEKPDSLKSVLRGAADRPPDGFLGICTSASRTRDGLAVRVSSDRMREKRPKDMYMHLLALGTLRPTMREFDAITGLGRVSLRSQLLSGHPVSVGTAMESLGQPWLDWLRNKFNSSQQEAIQAATTSEGFTLIKGPPGTGKTTTLKALLNALHQREYNRYYEKLLGLARVPPKETEAAWNKLSEFSWP
ncbi:unnamed protein product, partial [Discosporangium mesarthrocarpum]